MSDPFTRRSTKPRMNFKPGHEPEQEPQEQIAEPVEIPIEKTEAPAPQQPVQVTQDDLFSAHDFDITIDLEVPLPSNYLPYIFMYFYVTITFFLGAPVSVTPKATANSIGPKRSLNLQDYKKKRGLI